MIDDYIFITIKKDRKAEAAKPNPKRGEGFVAEPGIKNKLLYFLSDSRSEIANVKQSETGNRRNVSAYL